MMNSSSPLRLFTLEYDAKTNSIFPARSLYLARQRTPRLVQGSEL